MSTVLNPCHCGYSGALAGMRHQGVFYSLTCPRCNRSARAFTLEGLAESWNTPAGLDAAGEGASHV